MSRIMPEYEGVPELYPMALVSLNLILQGAFASMVILDSKGIIETLYLAISTLLDHELSMV